jgi:hypothetical protein
VESTCNVKYGLKFFILSTVSTGFKKIVSSGFKKIVSFFDSKLLSVTWLFRVGVKKSNDKISNEILEEAFLTMNAKV